MAGLGNWATLSLGTRSKGLGRQTPTIALPDHGRKRARESRSAKQRTRRWRSSAAPGAQESAREWHPRCSLRPMRAHVLPPRSGVSQLPKRLPPLDSCRVHGVQKRRLQNMPVHPDFLYGGWGLEGGRSPGISECPRDALNERSPVGNSATRYICASRQPRIRARQTHAHDVSVRRRESVVCFLHC